MQKDISWAGVRAAAFWGQDLQHHRARSAGGDAAAPKSLSKESWVSASVQAAGKELGMTNMDRSGGSGSSQTGPAQVQGHLCPSQKVQPGKLWGLHLSEDGNTWRS